MKTLKFHGIHPMYDTFMLHKLIYQLYSTVILSLTDHHFNKTNFLLGQLIKYEISRVSEFIFSFSKWLIPKSELGIWRDHRQTEFFLSQNFLSSTYLIYVSPIQHHKYICIVNLTWKIFIKKIKYYTSSEHTNGSRLEFMGNIKSRGVLF